MVKLRGGYTTEDPRLDRVPFFDERSRKFPVTAVIEQRTPRSYSWNKTDVLDQGREGACVGFSLAHELAARPKVHPADAALALSIYREAQKIDEWSGESYSGTSVLAGAKICTQLGYFSEYRWAFGEDDLALAVSYRGPAVLGIAWYAGMYQPDADGYVWPTGDHVGWHAILCPSYSVPGYARKHGASYRLDNSWGLSYGRNGSGYVTKQVMADLLAFEGEALVPTRR